MPSYQKIEIIGHLARDPEMRYTATGTAVTNFSVPVNEKWTDNNGVEHERVTWFRCTVWGKPAESFNKYGQKGMLVRVEGEIQGDPDTGNPRLFQKNDGSMGASFEVRVRFSQFLTWPDRDEQRRDEEPPWGDQVDEEEGNSKPAPVDFGDDPF